jgi:hypothetical protein
MTLSAHAAAVQSATSDLAAAEATLSAAPDADVKAAMAALVAGDDQPDGTVQAARDAVDAARVQLQAAELVYAKAQ